MTAKGAFNFNSIKVRLEQHILHAWEIAPEFQFHKGAIRTGIQSVEHLCESSFQFHKGAIRTKSKQQERKRENQFQFHKGAIRTSRRSAKIRW